MSLIAVRYSNRGALTSRKKNVRLCTKREQLSTRSRERNLARNTRFRSRLLVIRAARKRKRNKRWRYATYRENSRGRSRIGAARGGRRFAFPVRGISFEVLGSFPKQTETERLNGHRIATATPNHRKRERNANSTGTSTPCASYRGSF